MDENEPQQRGGSKSGKMIFAGIFAAVILLIIIKLLMDSPQQAIPLAPSPAVSPTVSPLAPTTGTTAATTTAATATVPATTTSTTTVVAAPTTPAFTDCYGASTGKCVTCDDVINAYKEKGWTYDINSFQQCKGKQPATTPTTPQYQKSGSTDCYGASTGKCSSCADVINAYKTKGWGYDASKIAQCNVDWSSKSQSCYDTTTSVCKSCNEVINAVQKKTGTLPLSLATYAQCSAF